MFYLLGRGLRGLFYGIDFVLFTALPHALSHAPTALTRRLYPRLSHAWCRRFARALGVELRLHQHNIRP